MLPDKMSSAGIYAGTCLPRSSQISRNPGSTMPRNTTNIQNGRVYGPPRNNAAASICTSVLALKPMNIWIIRNISIADKHQVDLAETLALQWIFRKHHDKRRTGRHAPKPETADQYGSIPQRTGVESRKQYACINPENQA
jgi:hypothetical protein